jgi:Flp pilus assembly protein TadD
MDRLRSCFAIGSALVVATLAVYWPVLRQQFVNFDDDVYVLGNRKVQDGLTAQSIDWAWTTTRASNWHPLTWLSLQLDGQLYGLKPGGYHLTNLLLHVANTLLLLGFLRRATGAVWRSGLVAALFAVHPLHVESVAWVAERKDVLSTLFWMLTLWGYLLYTRRPGPGRLLGVVLPFALGLLAKPMLVTLPCVLLLLDYWPLRRFPGQADAPPAGSDPATAAPGWLIVEKLPLLALAAASCGMTIYAQHKGGAMASLEHFPLSIRGANAVLAYAGYVLKLLWPVHLAPFYPHPRQMPPAWQVAAATLLLVGVTAVVLWQRRRRPYLLVGWLWYLGTLVPVIGLVQVGLQAMADRYTYVPLIGLFLMVAWGLGEVATYGREWRRVASLAAVLALVACAACSAVQVRRWQDSETLWTYTLSVTTYNAAAHNNLARVFEEQGRWDEALTHYQAAWDIDPDFALYRHNLAFAHDRLGSFLGKQGRLDEAVAHFRAALKLRPAYAEAHNDLGAALERQGHSEEAGAHFREAVCLDPELAEAHYNLGTVLVRQDRSAAADEFREALRINPKLAAAHYSLAVLLGADGKLDEAHLHYQALLELDQARLAEQLRRQLDEYARQRSPRG